VGNKEKVSINLSKIWITQSFSFPKNAFPTLTLNKGDKSGGREI
jgi:hypothetical protein